jgi:hypothetical protein
MGDRYSYRMRWCRENRTLATRAQSIVAGSNLARLS